MGAPGTTPGEWVLKPEYYGYDLCIPGIISQTSGGWFIQLHSGAVAGDTAEFLAEFEANAHQIKASGALYDATLQAAEGIQHLREMASHWSADQKQAFLNGLEQSARAALSLARGGKS